jgi:hypothetical protein
MEDVSTEKTVHNLDETDLILLVARRNKEFLGR